MVPIKALTVRQPYAYALTALGKDVENRVTLWKHRGLLAVHAGAAYADYGFHDPTVLEAASHRRGDTRARAVLVGGDLRRFALARSAIVGVVTVDDVHKAVEGCCTSPWAQYPDGDPRHVHMVVSNPVDFVVPVECGGGQGLWDLPEDVEADVLAQVEKIAGG